MTDVSTVKEGWTLKRGEYIKNWRPRYFVLKSDGSFLGHKEKNGPAVNSFTVKKAQIMKADKPKPFILIIRCFQWTTLVERNFAFDSHEEREEWISAIQSVINSARSQEEEKNANVSKRDGEVTLNDFDLLRTIAKGKFGKVMLARNKTTREYHALKLLKREYLTATSDAPEEVPEPPFFQKRLHAFRSEGRLCFVMDYTNGGELFFHLSTDKVFTEDRTRFYAAEIVLVLEFLHSHDIIYGNMKLEKLLLDHDGHIKLTDSGVGEEGVLSPEYMAPEVLEENEPSQSLDWWGLGLILYEMMCGCLPFYNRKHEVLTKLILSEEVSFPSSLSTEARSLLAGLLTKDPTKRLGGGPTDAGEVKSHEFFSAINWQDVAEKKLTPPFIPEVKTDVDGTPESFSPTASECKYPPTEVDPPPSRTNVWFLCWNVTNEFCSLVLTEDVDQLLLQATADCTGSK